MGELKKICLFYFLVVSSLLVFSHPLFICHLFTIYWRWCCYNGVPRTDWLLLLCCCYCCWSFFSLSLLLLHGWCPSHHWPRTAHRQSSVALTLLVHIPTNQPTLVWENKQKIAKLFFICLRTICLLKMLSNWLVYQVCNASTNYQTMCGKNSKKGPNNCQKLIPVPFLLPAFLTPILAVEQKNISIPLLHSSCKIAFDAAAGLRFFWKCYPLQNQVAGLYRATCWDLFEPAGN